MSSDPQKNDLDATLSATTDIDSLLQSPAPEDELFAPGLGTSPGGLLGEPSTTESQEIQMAAKEGESAAEEAEETAEEEDKKPSRLAVLLEKFDIYASLLAVSLFALLLGCLFLWVEWGRYGRDTKAKTSKTHHGVTVSSPWVQPTTRV